MVKRLLLAEMVFRYSVVGMALLPAINVAHANPILTVSPSGLENTEGNLDTTSNSAITPLRFQNLHDASAFAGLADNQRRLVGLAFRLDQSWPAPLTIGFPDLEIRLSTTGANSLSTTFVDNIGSDESLVFSGDQTVHYPIGTTPRSFGEPIYFDTPFEYDPNFGNLLVDMRMGGGTDTGFSFDIQSTPGVTSWVQNFDINNAGGQPFQTVLVTQFIFVPEPPGDYNQDGAVDAADYVTWRKNDAANNPLPNDNGLPTQQERYDLWKANFGQTLSPGSGAALPSAEPLSAVVPEPSTLSVTILSLLGLLRLRNKRL